MTDESTPFAQAMAAGARLHAAGQPEQALLRFEQAVALRPQDANAASACATLLTELGQPAAAYEQLLRVREELLRYADGAANLAIAAENCGRVEDARAAYRQALACDPTHLRALNNTALLEARSGHAAQAIALLQQCSSLAPDQAAVWLNLADALASARRFDAALKAIDQGLRLEPEHPALRVRQVVVQAFAGQIAQAQAGIDAMAPALAAHYRGFVQQLSRSQERTVRGAASHVPDAHDLFCQQAFDAMQVCDWRDHDRLTATLREAVAHGASTGQGRDWRDAQFYGLMLPLDEDMFARMRVLSIDTIGRRLTTPMPEFRPVRALRDDGRIRVGLAVQSLRDPRVANAIARQLALHDTQRFALHVYSPTPDPDFGFTRQLESLGASVVEIAHMSDDEAVGRMRLDALDLFMDMAFDTPWCRPEIPQRRVAPVQLRQLTWHRHHPPRPCEYNMSDTFVHPPGVDMGRYGAVVRLPYTCWLATNDDAPAPERPDRVALGLPAEALVLCALLPPLMVDPASFSLWMRMLRSLPQAVLWLPAFPELARTHLASAARDAGVDPGRILYRPRGSRAQKLARLGRADFFVDALRFNAGHGLSDALRMGLPALSCAGSSMASRLGGSVLRAAGLADCVSEDPEAMLQQVIRLGQDRRELDALRLRLQAARASAPFFSSAERVREWESAWQTMVERHRAGLAPAAFDVPAAAGAAADADA